MTDLRIHIVDAAIALLEEEGAKGFGQVRVARRAGIQQGHLTYYFPKKTDLVRAVLERVTERTRRELGGLLARAPELPREALHDLFFAQIAAVMRDRKRARVLLALVVEAQDDPDTAAVLAEQMVVQRTFMAGLLGRAPDDIDVHIALAALRGFGMESLLGGDDPARVEAVIARFRSWLSAVKL